jgi:hypothetical protein
MRFQAMPPRRHVLRHLLTEEQRAERLTVNRHHDLTVADIARFRAHN